jgi:Rhamnan synthesis protein F
MKDKIILIAHFDAAGRLTADWRRLIARLKAEDFAELVLISTGIDASAYRESLQGVRVIERENIGYDFYSWRQAIVEPAFEAYHEAILINNSFYVVDAAKFCAALRAPLPGDVHFRGLTVSWERAFHAQSYFLQFSAEAIRSEAFGRFWRQMRPLSDRMAVIEHYELGLSRELGREFPVGSTLEIGPYEKFLMLRRGLKNSSWVNAANLDEGYERAKTFMNPSLMLWDCLLQAYGIVKKQLVHQNPLNWPIEELKQFVFSCILEEPVP